MSSSVFAVYLPDRRAPIHIEADSFAALGCEVVLHKNGDVIARTSDRGFVVRTDLMREGDPSPVVEVLAPSALSEFKPNPTPVWPFLAGVGAAFAALCATASWLV